ncbi:MAG: hypothetical protein R3A52_23650 [Polyangiales bacterium]
MPKFQKHHSRYSKLPGRDERKLSSDAQEALVEVMTIAACVDGMLEEGEGRALAMQILATPGFEGLDNHALARTVEAIALRVATEGIPARLHAIAQAIGDDLHTREEAFALATLFVLFDGEVGDEAGTPRGPATRSCTSPTSAPAITSSSPRATRARSRLLARVRRRLHRHTASRPCRAVPSRRVIAGPPPGWYANSKRGRRR